MPIQPPPILSTVVTGALPVPSFVKLRRVDGIEDPKFKLVNPGADPNEPSSYTFPIIVLWLESRAEIVICFPNPRVSRLMIPMDGIIGLADCLGSGFEPYGETRVTKTGAAPRDLAHAMTVLHYCN